MTVMAETAAVGANAAGQAPRTVAFVLPSLAGGGAERVTLELAAGLDRRFWRPYLVVLAKDGPLADRLPDDLPVLDLGKPQLRLALTDLVFCLRRLRPAATFSSLGYVNVALAGLRPLLPGRLVLREANLPSLSLPATEWPFLLRSAYRRLYPRADRVIATSARMARELAGFGVAADRLMVLPNPVPLRRLRADAARPERDPGPGPRFVAAGRLYPQKGFDRLLDWMTEAFPATGTARLRIFGDGGDRADLAAQIARLGLSGRVVLAGFESRIAPWFAGADAVLLPSRWEGLPNVALDALACGAPVIATPESGGIAEIAAAAAPGAVRIAAAGADFVAALQEVGARAVCMPMETAGSRRRLGFAHGEALGREIGTGTRYDGAFPRANNRGHHSRSDGGGVALRIRPSLLPAAYAADAVSQVFAQLLSDVVAGRTVSASSATG